MRQQRQVVVFWTAGNRRSWIGAELLQGRLRQGWAVADSQLAVDGVIVPLSTWAKRFADGAKKQWDWNPNDADILKRYRILARMLSLREGDLVVVPEMPSEDEFTIARVTNGYTWDDRHYHSSMPGPDFGHVMQVDRTQLASYTYHSSPDAAAVAAKFRIYRSAVNHVRDEQYAETVRRLFEERG